MKNIFNKILSIVLILCTIIPCFTLNIAAAYSSDDILTVAKGIIEWKKSDNGSTDGYLINNTYLEQAGSTAGDWYQIGMSRLEIEDNYESYLAVVKQQVEERYKKRGKLSASKSTEWHRISLSILACGGNPENFGTDENGNPINLIADGTYNRGKTVSLGRQGINGWIWGLIALNSKDYTIPEDAFYTEDSIIEEILKKQLSDGGFALTGKTSDPDITAMAIQALAPYYESHSNVKSVIDQSLSLLSGLQLSTGDFASWGVRNAESTAQVIIALCALGIDPLTDTRFIKEDNTLLDGLMCYRMDDGGFIHSFTYDAENPTSKPNESNSMAGEQALLALAAIWRLQNNKTFIYDFRDTEESDKPVFNEADKSAVDNLPQKLTTADYVTVITLLEKLENSPDFEDKTEYYNKLISAKEKIEKIQQDIDDINNQINNMGDSSSHSDNSSKIQENTDNTNSTGLLSPDSDSSSGNTNSSSGNKTNTSAVNGTVQDDNTAEEFDTLTIEQEESLEKDKSISSGSVTDLDSIIEKYESLSESDKKKINGYEEVIKAKTKETTAKRALVIAIICIITIALLTVITVRRFKKRKNRKNAEMEELAAMYSDEE